MAAEDVIAVIGALEAAGVPVWLDGGWAVDALVREQTRLHDDLDLVVALADADTVIGVLEPAGFRLSLDRRPTRFVVEDRHDRRIDFHPVVFDEHGSGKQIGAGPTGGDAVFPTGGFAGRGSIEGSEMRCLSPELLLRFHLGYEPKERDRHNVRLLCARFDLRTPGPYQ